MNTFLFSKLFPGYAGEWAADTNATHTRLTQVTYDGSAYLSLADTTMEDVPGVSGKWWCTSRGLSAEEVAEAMATQAKLETHAKLAATDTQAGHVQMATDAQAAAGTNTSNAVNAKQLHANSMRTDFSNATGKAALAEGISKHVAGTPLSGRIQFDSQYPNGAQLILTSIYGANQYEGVSLGWRTDGTHSLMPFHTNTGASGLSLGSPQNSWTQLFAQSGTIALSDARLKSLLNGTGEIPDSLMRAWGRVRYRLYKMKDAIAEKGEGAARIHCGILAQEAAKELIAEGDNPEWYGWYCEDKWLDTPAVTEAYTVEISPAECDAEGNVIKPAVTEEHTRVILPGYEAGERLSIRYEELLCMEAAYTRWIIAKIMAHQKAQDARYDALETRLATLEAR